MCSTARGFDCGTALTFVCPADEKKLSRVEERLRGDTGKELSVHLPCGSILYSSSFKINSKCKNIIGSLYFPY